MGSTSEAARRAIRAFVPRPSALRRTSDRVQVLARWVLLVAGLLVVPVALAAGSAVTAKLAPQVAAQRADRHQVVAEVLTVPDVGTESGPDVAVEGRAPVRWIAADGTVRVAVVTMPATARPGDPETLWVDRQDRPTVAPMTTSYPAAQGFFTTATILLGDLFVSLGLLAALRWVLDRRRLRAWDAAWRRFTPPGQENVR